jgi:hypothetical protein
LIAHEHTGDARGWNADDGIAHGFLFLKRHQRIQQI